VGGLLGLVFGAGCLVWASAPPPLLRPAAGLLLLARVAVVVPPAVVLGGRLAVQLGEQVLRWVRRSWPRTLATWPTRPPGSCGSRASSWCGSRRVARRCSGGRTWWSAASATDRSRASWSAPRG